MRLATVSGGLAPLRALILSRWSPGLGVALVLAAFYWSSAATRAGGGDWGQFQTFGYMGGIAHPPGYPLIIGSTYLATRVVGFAEPAHVANIVGATYAVAAGVVLFYASWLLTRSRLAALLATVVFATGYSIWAEATQVGFVSVQTLLVFLLVGTLSAYDDQPTASRLIAVAFATGLSLTNHGLSIFMLPATAMFVVSRRSPGIASPGTLARVAAAFTLGLTPWLHVLRGLVVPVPIDRPEKLTRLSLLDLRRQVIDRSLAKESQSGASDQFLETGRQKLLAEWPSFAHDTLREYGWVWIVPALVGWIVLTRQRPRLAAWIAWTGLATLWFSLVTPPLLDSDRYFSVIFALLAVCLAVGIKWAMREVPRIVGAIGLDRLQMASLVVSLAVVLSVGLRIHQQLTGPARINVVRLRENAEEQAEMGLGIVRQMERGSVYFTNWTSSWYPRYARHVLGVDRDLSIETVDYGSMGFERASEILASGRRLYLQRSTPQYERAFNLVKRSGVFYEVLPKT